MYTGNPSVPSRNISKERSRADSSLRFYYGVASGAVPFTWESQPGTPKHKSFCDASLPPLTPPPSYHLKSKKKPSKIKTSRAKFLRGMLPSLSHRRTHSLPSFSSLSSSSSSTSSTSHSFWVSSAPRSSSSPRISFDLNREVEDPAFEVICTERRSWFISMKRALLSFVSIRSS